MAYEFKTIEEIDDKEALRRTVDKYIKNNIEKKEDERTQI